MSGLNVEGISSLGIGTNMGSRIDFLPQQVQGSSEIIETKRSAMVLMTLTSLFLLTTLHVTYHVMSDPLRAFLGPTLQGSPIYGEYASHRAATRIL